MKIAYVSRTLHTGLPEKMAMAVNQYTSHEAVALVPGTWMDGKRTFLPGERTPLLWNVNDEEQRNHVLETSDVLHFIYTTSLHDLGRQDLLKKKLVFWHLATKWHDSFKRLFPSGVSGVKLLVSAEGWCRWGFGCWRSWDLVPVIFLLDHPLYTPKRFARRTRHASMSPRISLDVTDSGEPIAAPRSMMEIKSRLRGIKFKTIRRTDFPKCMNLKGLAWVGIDDVVQPLLHQSGLEYLALGVPCLNASDQYLREMAARTFGTNDWPFISADIAGIRSVVKDCLDRPRDNWFERSMFVMEWMRSNLHPINAIGRYMDHYKAG